MGLLNMVQLIFHPIAIIIIMIFLFFKALIQKLKAKTLKIPILQRSHQAVSLLLDFFIFLLNCFLLFLSTFLNDLILTFSKHVSLFLGNCWLIMDGHEEIRNKILQILSPLNSLSLLILGS